MDKEIIFNVSGDNDNGYIAISSNYPVLCTQGSNIEELKENIYSLIIDYIIIYKCAKSMIKLREDFNNLSEEQYCFIIAKLSNEQIKIGE